MTYLPWASDGSMTPEEAIYQLVRELRNSKEESQRELGKVHWAKNTIIRELSKCKKRAEKAEAKLEKAVKYLEHISKYDQPECGCGWTSREALKELRGEK